MKPLPVAEIRERFLRFFEERGHQRLPSDSLIPANDPTLLFTGAGMNQFKEMFLGKGSLPHKRITTAQKCLRVPDLENVGLTPRHHTFFEMLGNFSFGDYFKKECIAWEWEFFHKELEIPQEQMVVTIYEDDEEAFQIWRDDIGLDPKKIFRFGEKENFWPAEAPSKGPNGPCGPCSEIYFDANPNEPYPDHEGLQDLPDGRFTEIGNCVFTQFDRQEDGSLDPLPQKNIDVGLGLERIAAVLAGVETNFETDLFLPFLDELGKRTGVPYGEDQARDIRMRRITDHIRAITFCIADGAVPSNEGRGYVVRKILRRAARDGFEIGLEQPFLHELVDVVGRVMGDAYPEVREHAGQCRSVIKGEEEGFAAAYHQGKRRLDDFLGAAESSSVGGSLQDLEGSGTFAFQLHDTYGFPVDITRQVMAERGYRLDDEAFEQEMGQQRERARAAASTSEAVFADSASMILREAGVESTEFTGYSALEEQTSILAIIGEGHQLLEEATEGDEVMLVTAKTPFYAQGGGQIGDRGSVSVEGGNGAVRNTTSLDGYHLHAIRVESGAMKMGSSCRLHVDEAARCSTERNHTATHLLHAALKDILGEHVSQAGSEVSPERLRFDFTHGEKMTAAQIDAVEIDVNREIMKAIPVESAMRDIDEAKGEGFLAMFGEKYAKEVRTVAVGEYSRELCGGTHVKNSGNIGPFRILSEAAVSAGTRRMEAVTGSVALELGLSERRGLSGIAQQLKVTPAECSDRVSSLIEEHRKLRKQLQKALAADIASVLEQLMKAANTDGGVTTVVFETQGLTMKEIQDLLQRARAASEAFAGVVLVRDGGQVLVAASVSPDLHAKIGAGKLVELATKTMGGGGGGRPEMAQGKGKDAGKLPAAAIAVEEALAAVRG